jgi:hypothetical protein
VVTRRERFGCAAANLKPLSIKNQIASEYASGMSPPSEGRGCGVEENKLVFLLL